MAKSRTVPEFNACLVLNKICDRVTNDMKAVMMALWVVDGLSNFGQANL